MLRKVLLLACFVSLVGVAAFAGSYPFAGAGPFGVTAPCGNSWLYNADGATLEPDWGIPGVGAGTLAWCKSTTITDFEITFDLPPGTVIDPAQILVGNGAGCVGSTGGGTTFCASPYSAPWTAALLASNSIAFYASPGNALTNGDAFFVNIFFSGPDPGNPGFSGAWTYTPEPGTMLLFGSGIVGLAGVLRRKLRI